MNNRDRAQQIADEHNNDAYSVALRLVGHENEIRGLKRQLQEEINSVSRHKDKLKAEAVREAADALYSLDLSCGRENESEYEVKTISEHTPTNWRTKMTNKVEIPDWLIAMSNNINSDPKNCTAHPFWQVRCKRYLPTPRQHNEHHWEIVDVDEGDVVYRSDLSEDYSDLAQRLFESNNDWCRTWNQELDEPFDFEIDGFADAFCEYFDPDIEDLPDSYEIFYMQEIEEVVSTHLTKSDAEWFIKRKQHDYPKLYLYTASAYWSPELKKLQDWIRGLTDGERVA